MECNLTKIICFVFFGTVLLSHSVLHLVGNALSKLNSTQFIGPRSLPVSAYGLAKPLVVRNSLPVLVVRLESKQIGLNSCRVRSSI